MVAQAHEIELKFLCDPADVPALLAALPPGEDREAEMSATYFDTPERALREREAGLRLRDEPGGRRQTLKAGRGIRRIEAEITPAGDGLDLSHAALLDLIGAETAARLEPLFEVRVRRTLRDATQEGGEIEIAIDQGEIRAGRRRRRLCELELELKAGEPRLLFDLARRLFDVAPLYLSFETKADQGFALVEPPSAHRHDGVRLSADQTAAETFQALMRSGLSQLAANGLLLRAADTAEAIHQLRVAARRMRSALSTFKGLLDAETAEAIKGELKWIASACGEARELDVFIDETYGPAARSEAAIHGLADLGQALEAARSKAHAKARAAVASARFRRLLLDLCAWVETGDWLAALEDGGGPAGDFAAHGLARRRRKLARKGRGLSDLDDAARHQVRIEAKKLRYAAEGFRSLLDDKAARRFLKRLRKVQASLGALNDAAAAEALLTRLKVEGAGLYAAGHLAGEMTGRRADLMATAQDAWDRFKAVDDPW
ncbi:MAG: CHAD domain-containing protein [Pseudomonadota bacterium]